jgi:hypothetical protein
MSFAWERLHEESGVICLAYLYSTHCVLFLAPASRSMTSFVVSPPSGEILYPEQQIIQDRRLVNNVATLQLVQSQVL